MTTMQRLETTAPVEMAAKGEATVPSALQEVIARNPKANPNVLTVREIMADVVGHYRLADALTAVGGDPKKNFSKIICGAELGIGPFASVRGIHFIETSRGVEVAMSAQLMAGLAEQDGWSFAYSDSEPAGQWCEVKATKEGRDAVVFRWTIEMARKIQCPKKGGGTYSLSEKDNWRHYPWSMLRSRCVAEVARRCSPGRLLGLYDPDEIDDIADRPAPRKFSTTTNVSPLNADLPEATTQQEPEPAATPTPESRGPVSNFERCMEATGLPRKEASAMVHNYISTNPVPLDADGEPTDEAMPMLLAELRKMRAEAAAAEATEPLWGGE